MKVSARIVLLIAAFSLMASNAFAEHSEVDTYVGPTGAATVAHVDGSCAAFTHTGGGCFVQFDEGDSVTIRYDDAVIATTGVSIVFRPASGADLAAVRGCMDSGADNGPYEVPEGTNRIVVFLGSVIDTTTNAPVCPGATQPTTGTVTATYVS